MLIQDIAPFHLAVRKGKINVSVVDLRDLPDSCDPAYLLKKIVFLVSTTAYFVLIYYWQ